MSPLAAQDPPDVGPYRLIGALGEGGMGRVLLATGPDGRPAAVKVVHDFLARDPVFRERFRREIAACRLVSGAYTAPVLAADADATSPWLATLYVPGPSLRQVVDTTGALPRPSAQRLAIGLATALADIHRAGLIHRDLKPGNVLLTHDGPRVIDFGIARAAEDEVELTHTGSIIGSPEFMSPEQAHGHRLTAATDMFSLGATLVLAATGRSPFAGTSAAQTLYNVAHTEPDLGDVPQPLRELVTACLDKDPQRRPTPTEILDRLTDLGPTTPGTAPWTQPVHELIHARETETRQALAAPPARPRTPRRRQPVLLGIAATLAVAGLATLVVLTGDTESRAGRATLGELQTPAADTPSSAPSADEDDEPLSPARLRKVDACRVLSEELNPRPVVHLSACTYEHEDGRWFDLTLGDAVPMNPTATDEVDAAEAAGLPLVLDAGGEGRCEAVAVLPRNPELGISVDVGPGGGDVTEKPCAGAHTVLTKALDQLTAGGPEREPMPGSIATVDPCTLLEASEVSDVFSVATTPVPDRLHGCRWEVSGTLDLELATGVDPAALPEKWTPEELGGRTVHVQSEPAEVSPTCTISWTQAKLPSDVTTLEVVSLRYYAAGSGLPIETVCGDTRAAAKVILERLPTP